MTDLGPSLPSDETSLLIAGIAALPAELGRLLQGRSTEALRRPASDGGWGAIEHLCHLRDWNAVFQARIEAIAGSDHPVLETYDDELWVIDHHYREQDPSQVRDLLRQERQVLVDALYGLPPSAWERTGQLGQHEVTIRDIAERVRDHDREHLRAITDALA